MLQRSWDRIYRRFGLITILTVYLLILAGGVVRCTGSGMGCPDWPKCFGSWVPPTDESQLPFDYKEKYKGHAGYEVAFNVWNTWIEYLNRLLGAVVGLLMIALVAFSLKLKNKQVLRLSILALILVIIEGLIGKYVVDTNLKPIAISIHMYGSIVIILLLIYTVSLTWRPKLSGVFKQEIAYWKNITVLLIVLTLVQIYLGSMVRQEIDSISVSMNGNGRESWIDQLSNVFLVHRSYSILLFALHAFLAWKLLREENKIIKISVIMLMLVLVLEIMAGITMNYFNVPAAAQPLHLLLGVMLLGIQFFIWINIKFSESSRT